MKKNDKQGNEHSNLKSLRTFTLLTAFADSLWSFYMCACVAPHLCSNIAILFLSVVQIIEKEVNLILKWFRKHA